MFQFPFASMLPGYEYIWNGGGCSLLRSLIFWGLVIVGLSSWFFLRYQFQQCVNIHLLVWQIIIANLKFVYAHLILPILVVARSEASSAVTRLLGMWVRIPPGHGCLSPVIVLFCQLQVSAMGRSFVQRSLSKCGVSVYDREA
jgi:hypothetical protein